MDKNTEQKIPKKDLQALIEESNRHRQWENTYRIAQLIVTPLIITLVSVGVTWRINIQQGENTKQITEKQIESAQIIAKANREQSAKESESSQHIQRLTQIKQIFTSLLSVPENNEKELKDKRMQIISMEVYKEDALIFLLNLKEHYQGRTKPCYKDLIVQVDKSILNILGNSQVNVSGRLFMDCISSSDTKYSCKYLKEDLDKFREKKFEFYKNREAIEDKHTMDVYTSFIEHYEKFEFNELNLRQQEYKNYNFSNCTFLSVNLFSADFSDCTLGNNIFMNVDLQQTSFAGSNLTGSYFRGCNLQRANFMDSRLRDVVFVNPILNKRNASEEVNKFCKEKSCCEMEGAQFALGSLLWTANPPFDVFDKDNIDKELAALKLDSLDVEKKSELLDAIKKQRQNLYINLLINHHKSIAIKAKSKKAKDKKEIENLLRNTGTESWPELIKILKENEERAKTWKIATSLTKDVSSRAL